MGRLNIFTGQPIGDFIQVLSEPTSTTANGQAMIDLHHDGVMDLISVNLGIRRLLLNQKDGTLALSPNGLKPGQPTRSILSADCNGDGHLDLVTLSYNAELSPFLGHRDGTLLPAMATTSAQSDNSGAYAAEIDGDGRIDIAVADTL